MKTRKRVKTYSNMETMSKAKRLLRERNEFKRLHFNEYIEHRKTERGYKIEIERAGFYHDCVDFLLIALITGNSQDKEEKEEILIRYKEYEQKRHQTFIERKNVLSKIEVSAYDKEVVYYLDNEKL